MNTNKLFALFVCAFIALGVSAHEACCSRDVVKSTIDYKYLTHNDSKTDTLRMDFYRTYSVEDVDMAGRKHPALIFVFGGGFKGGQRDSQWYESYFEFFAREGFAVFSIDYRLGLAGMTAEQLTSPLTFMGALTNAVNMAVDDLYSATAEIVSNAATYGVDAQRVIATGSSAGAITVLQAEYGIANGSDAASMILPEGFNYAGIISMAGAILSMGDVAWSTTPAPIMMFHGSSDNMVPYDRCAMPGFGGLFGTKTIAASLADNQDATTCVYIYDNYDHSVATLPMTDNRYDMLAFIYEQAFKADAPTQVRTLRHDAEHGTGEAQYTIADYLKANMGY